MATVYFNDSGKNIHVKDMETGVTSILFTTDLKFYDIAFASNTFYGIEAGKGEIYTYDSEAGESTLFVDIKEDVNALTSDEDGNLYAAGRGETLYKITPAGEISDLGKIGKSEGDIVYMENSIYMTNTSEELVKYDIETGELTTIATHLANDLYGLAKGAEGTLLAFEDNGNVWTIDLETGESTKSDKVDEVGDVLGAAEAPDMIYPLGMEQDFEDLAELIVGNWEDLTPPDGWYTDNNNGKLEIGYASEYGVDSQNVVVELETNGSDNGNHNLYTFIESQVGAIVKIDFDYSGRVNHLGDKGDFEVIVDGEVIETISADAVGFVNKVVSVLGTGEPMRIEFKATDGDSYGSVLDNIKITQAFLNQNPVAEDDYATGEEDTALTIAVSELLQNDVDPDGDYISEFSVQDSTNGVVSLVNDTVVFMPDAGYTGPASFTYSITDGKGGFDLATVHLTIEAAAATGAVAVDDQVDGYADNALYIAPETLLGNDYDAAGGDIYGASLGDAENGEVYWDGTQVVFIPTEGYTGAASFTYTIKNDDGDLDTATVNLTIADNTVMGTDADETVTGTALNEVIIGGLGSDDLYGAAGADTFTWRLADVSTDAPSTDVIKDGEYADKIDISDLLTDSSTLEALDSDLDFSVDNGNTVIDIKVDDNDSVDQTIIIEGFDATAGGTLSDMQVIENLMNSGHLIVD